MLPVLKVNEISSRQDILSHDVAGSLSARTPWGENWRKTQEVAINRGWATARDQGCKPMREARRRTREESARRDAVSARSGTKKDHNEQVCSPTRKVSRIDGCEQSGTPMRELAALERTDRGTASVSSRPETQSEIGEWDNSDRRRARSRKSVAMSEPAAEAVRAFLDGEESMTDAKNFPRIRGKPQGNNIFSARGTASVALKAERFGDAHLSAGRGRNPRYINSYPFHSWQTRCDSREECRSYNAFKHQVSPRTHFAFEPSDATAAHNFSAREAKHNRALQEDHICPYGREPQDSAEKASIALQPKSMIGAQGARQSVSAKANRGWRWCNGVFRPKQDIQMLDSGRKV